MITIYTISIYIKPWISTFCKSSEALTESMATSYTNGISAPGLTSAAILLLAWSLLSFIVRLWVKLGKIDFWGGDDTTVSAAFVRTPSLWHGILLTRSIVDHRSARCHNMYRNQPWLWRGPCRSGKWTEINCRKGHFENHHSEILVLTNNSEQALYASQILYVVSVGLIRISVGLFIAKLTRDSRRIRLVRILTWICVLSTAADILLIAIRGDVRMPWSTTSSSSMVLLTPFRNLPKADFLSIGGGL